MLLGLLIVCVGLIFIGRAFGSWMLRIDEVINELKAIRKKLEE